MIQWASQLYVGVNMEEKKDNAIAMINNKQATYGVYCITFASQPDNLFDIMDANELLFPHYSKVKLTIIGLAKGREEAIMLVHDMLMEVYRETGAFDVRTYFT